VSNVLSQEKKQQVIALGRLGWSLRRIQESVGVRRETAASYLRAAGLTVRPPGGWGWPPPAKAAIKVITDPPVPSGALTASAGLEAPRISATVESVPSKPAIEVITDSLASDPESVGLETPVTPATAESIPPKPAIEVITDVDAEFDAAEPADEAHPSRNPSASACVAHREAIELGLSRGRNAKAIWQDLVDTVNFTAGYQSVRRFVRKLQAGSSPEPRAIIETPPGEEAQVDYGEGPMVRDPHTGKYKRTRLFVLTLGFSRKCVRLLVFRSSSQTWAELHEKAFRRLGGVTRIVVLDNLREGVLTPDIYDPALNPLYKDVLAHYGTVALPCRVRDPDRKGKVEAGVAHAQKTPLKGLRFESLPEAQAYLDRWEERWADTRIHGTTKRQVAAMFVEERPSLLPLPLEPFRYYQYGERTVVAWKSKRPITVPHRAGSAGAYRCSGTPTRSDCWTRSPASCCANTCGTRGAVTASRTRIAPRIRRYRLSNCCCAPTGRARRSASCAAACTKPTARPPCATSWGFSRWSRNTVTPRWRLPARRR